METSMFLIFLVVTATWTGKLATPHTILPEAWGVFNLSWGLRFFGVKYFTCFKVCHFFKIRIQLFFPPDETNNTSCLAGDPLDEMHTSSIIDRDRRIRALCSAETSCLPFLASLLKSCTIYFLLASVGAQSLGATFVMHLNFGNH